jgi:hypothetical protein
VSAALIGFFSVEQNKRSAIKQNAKISLMLVLEVNKKVC